MQNRYSKVYESEDQTFSTRDINLAATLITLKIFHININFSLEGTKNNAIGYFVFEDTPELQEAELRYRRGEILVEPKAFMANVHSLKAEVMNLTRNPNFNS